MVGLVFFTCELGQQLTNTLARFEYKFEQLDWYLFPVKVQRSLPTVLNNVQKPVEIGCFGILRANRDQFKNVYLQYNTVKYIFRSNISAFSTFFLICHRWSGLCTKVSVCCVKFSNEILK